MKQTATDFGRGLIDAWAWQAGDVLTVFAMNDVDVGPCTYGALYAGGVASPANPSYSARELAYMIQDAGAKALVTQKGLLSVALEAATLAKLPQNRIILLGADKNPDFLHFTELSPRRHDDSLPRPRLHPDTDLAFLVYSSGTTGLPKGVMLSHRNIIADVLMISNSVGRSYHWQTDKVLGVLPFYHIYGSSLFPFHALTFRALPSPHIGTDCSQDSPA